jgi:hypothetical protein
LARPDVPGLYILSPSARRIWEGARSGLSFEAVVREFGTEYDISRQQAENDVTRTFAEWQHGLLSREFSPSPRKVAGDAGFCASSDFFVRDYLIQGKSVRIILQNRELKEEISPRLESLPQAPSDPDFVFTVVQDSSGYRIFRDQLFLGSEESIGEARGVLLQEIVRSCRGRDCLAIFHAGACGSDARCVVFPATTQSGKTTLAAVLMKQGLTFYGDDSILLERDTLSVPVMPFALTVREGSWAVLSQRFPELQEAPVVTRYGQRVRFLAPVGLNQDGHCEKVEAIVFVRYGADAANELRTIDTLQTLMHLRESGFWVAQDRQSIGDFLAWIHSTSAFTLNYSDVDKAAAIIQRMVG